jgi:hypothetical protein
LGQLLQHSGHIIRVEFSGYRARARLIDRLTEDVDLFSLKP